MAWSLHVPLPTLIRQGSLEKQKQWRVYACTIEGLLERLTQLRLGSLTAASACLGG